ncbi:MAG: hypothetical protein NTU62_11820, partial [Spirochaetes bacterium]|nr:hypothetical protein [Spirochaetota bacterium]
RALGLAPLVPGDDRCVLVEEFNRILVSRVRLPGFRRAIRVFEEKDDLLPFEEAKLFGHNAVHALLGYLAERRGLITMSAIRVFEEQDDLLPFEEAKLFGHNAVHALLGYLAERRGLVAMSTIRGAPDLLALGRRAFLEESGAALIAKHASTGDPLFTRAGWRAYAEDLLVRMTNPWLADRVERIIRDPRRKLAWGDRFFGTMRVALSQGIEPRILALGAAAAVDHALRAETGTPAAAVSSPGAARRYLLDLWKDEADDGPRERCLELAVNALEELSP